VTARPAPSTQGSKVMAKPVQLINVKQIRDSMKKVHVSIVDCMKSPQVILEAVFVRYAHLGKK
jgi:hypothetical protein